MARQNVGTPKFYVDLIQYWHAKGMVAGIGPYGDSDGNYTEGIENICPEGFIESSDGSGWSPELIGYNPYHYIYANRGINNVGAGGGRLHNSVVLKEKTLLPAS